MPEKSIKLLIADDEINIRRGLKMGVDWAACGVAEVLTARDGEEALRICREQHVQLVLADVRMPGMTDLDFVKQLNYAPLRIIIMSGYAEFTYAQQAVRLGAVDYLLKPVNIEQLSKLVSRLVSEIEAQNVSDTLLGGVSSSGLERHQQFFSQNPALNIQNNTFSPMLLRALDYINLHYSERMSVEDVAQYIGKSNNYFSSHFKKGLGISFVDYLNLIRVNHAKRMLRQTDHMTYEIAEYVGYNDYKYFSTVFRRIVGVSPSEYRKGMDSSMPPNEQA